MPTMENRKDADTETKLADAREWLDRLTSLTDNADFKACFHVLLNEDILRTEAAMSTCVDSTELMRLQGEKNGLKRAKGKFARKIDELRRMILSADESAARSDAPKEADLGGY